MVKYQGMFWLPGQSKYKIAGILEIDDRHRITLSIQEFINHDCRGKKGNTHLDLSHHKHEQIYGIIDHKYCILLNSKLFSDYFKPYNYSSDTLLVSESINLIRKKKLRFNKVSLKLPNIEYLFGTCQFKFDIKDSCYDVKTVFQDLEYNIDNYYKLTISYKPKPILETNDYAQLKCDTRIELAYLKPVSIDNILSDDIHKISTFFTLIYGYYLCPSEIIFEDYPDNQYRYHITCVSNMFDGHFHVLNQRNILSLFDPIYLTEFLRFTKNNVLIYDAMYYIYSNYYQGSYSFLECITGLQQLVKKLYNDVYHKDEPTHTEVIKPLIDIIDSIPNKGDSSDYYNKIKTNLIHSRERSLKSTLKVVLNMHKPIIDNFFSEKTSNLAELMARVRNDMVHPKDDKTSNIKVSEFDLYDLYNKVRLIYKVCLFNELHMPEEMIIHILENR